MLITCPKCSVRYKIPSEIKLTEGKKVQCSACGHIFEFHPKSEEKSEKISLLPPEDAVLSMTSRTEKVSIRTVEPEKTFVPDTSPTLPEAFQPIQRQKSTQNTPYFWIVLCSILLIGFAYVGWIYRDSLLSDIYTTRPAYSNKTHLMKHSPKKRTRPVHQPPSVKPEFVMPDIPLEIENEPVSSETPLASSSNDLNEAAVPSANLSVQSVRFRKTPTGDAVLIEGILKNTTSEAFPVPEKIYAVGYDVTGSAAFEKEIYLPKGTLYPDMEQPFFGTYAPVAEEIQWVDVVLQK